MSVQKENLLDLANELNAGATEAHWRSSVSRAYYAAYHGCKDWHTALPLPGSNTGRNGGAHQQLINRLRNPDYTVPAEKRTLSRLLSARLEALRGRRHMADYDLPGSVDAVVAANTCAQVKEIFGKL